MRARLKDETRKRKKKRKRKEGRKEGRKEEDVGIEFSSKYEWAGVKSTLFMSGRIVDSRTFYSLEKNHAGSLCNVFNIVFVFLSFLFFFCFHLFLSTIIFNDVLMFSLS